MPASTILRITGGTARGLPLASPRGMRLRPTSGQVREAVFNILARRVEGARVLDLYAGTGAMGIEALSRGAVAATFVETDSRATAAILQSLSRAGFQGLATVLRGRLPGAVDTLPGAYDLIFVDPPYADPEGPAVLSRLRDRVGPGGMVVYEHGSRYNPPERPAGLILVDRRIYGDTAVAFYAPQEEG